jgi:hypothetical protein
MDAQQQIAELRRRLVDAEASAARKRVETDSAWRIVREEEVSHVEELRRQRAANTAALEAAEVVHVEELRRQRAAATAVLEAAEVVHRSRMHASHMRELDAAIAQGVELRELRRVHEAAMVAAVAAAREAERVRLQTRIGPVMLAMQQEQRQLLQESAVKRQRRLALESELTDTRQLVFDAVEDPSLLDGLGL